MAYGDEVDPSYVIAQETTVEDVNYIKRLED